MATKTHPLFSNFSSGEISPKLNARVDLAQYFNGASEIKNFICVQQGGVKTRGGFHFVRESKEAGVCRLIPFQFSELQNYMILFGEEYLWFFTDTGNVTNNLFPGWIFQESIKSTPWPASYFPQDSFRVTSNNVFRSVRREAVSSNYGGTRLVGQVIPGPPFEVETPYNVDNDLWSIRYAQDDENLYLVHPLYPPMILTKGVGHTFTINEMEFTDGPYEDAVESPTITPDGTSGDVTLTASSALFLSGHVGALWRLNHSDVWSWVKIIAVTSTTVATATVKGSQDTVAAATDSHREGAWSDVNGWPKQLCFSEGRLLFASNYEHAQNIWASKTNNYTDFTPGVLDNDPYTFVPADLNIIRWILPGRELNIGALNSEATAVGPTDSPISPASPPIIKGATTHGSSDLTAPLKIGNSVLFLQRSHRKIREFTYSFSNDAYGAPDLTIASEHLFESDIIDIIYQQEPDSLIWAIRNDTEGSILTCSYDRNVDPSKGGIVAWSKHFTDGRFESIASMPYEEQDQVWAVVHREINGVDKRYIEYYDENISVDSGLTYSGSPATVLSGMAHLAGKTVRIIGDGATYPSQVMPNNGVITIDPAASEIYVGLEYSPRVITNRPEVAISGGGSSQGLKKRWNKVTVRVLETTGITINGEVYPARDTEDEMDAAPDTYSEDLSITNLGWSTEGFITIEQPLSLPAHVVAVFGTLVVGDD